MASEKQSMDLTSLVLEAIRYRERLAGHTNPALGDALLHVQQSLLPWARRELVASLDAQAAAPENLVAEAAMRAFLQFNTFAGGTGGEFYGWVKSIATQLIAHGARRRHALRRRGLHPVRSFDQDAPTAALVKLLSLPGASPDEIAALHEDAWRLRLAVRQLNLVQRRVVSLRAKGHSLRAIAGILGHAPSWTHAQWESAAHEIRKRFLRGRSG